MKLAVIVARGGSKRIPRKNIRLFCGKPIIAYSIEAALHSDCFDEVMVSTDDAEIANIAKQYGATVPFIRSAVTADDFATTAEVLSEVLNEYLLRKKKFEYACCIYPTAPLIDLNHLTKGLNKLISNKNLDVVFPIVRFSFPIQRALCLDHDRVAFVNPEYQLTRSQDLEPTYHDAGQFYWLRVGAFVKNKLLISKNAAGILLSEYQAQDIDTWDDWMLAEMKYKLLHQKINV